MAVAFGMAGRRESSVIPFASAERGAARAAHSLLRRTGIVAAGDCLSRPVSLSDPDPDWPSQYTAEAALIERELAAFDPVVEHIGSTAVRLRAKPIVDIRQPDDSRLPA
jgi:hypothetical protein